MEDHVIELLDEAWPQLDALIVLDQVSEEDCGVVTKRVREQLAELGERDPDKFVLADSRERIGLFRNVCVKPNRTRMRRHSRRYTPIPTPTIMPRRVMLAERCEWVVFCTHGEEGILVASPDESGANLTSPLIPSPVRSTSSGRAIVARRGSPRRWCAG